MDLLESQNQTFTAEEDTVALSAASETHPHAFYDKNGLTGFGPLLFMLHIRQRCEANAGL